ncbi:MAG: pqiB 2 [Phycisphaerales bacterium]|nr:pqiB 2 [Phycisphaerales bacterium]
MNDQVSREPVDSLPTPRVSKQRWPFPLVWLVPIIAGLAVAWYLYGISQQHGTEITISFEDASGLKIKDTPVTFHGVRVGTIVAIDLDEDRRRSLVHVRLERTYEKDIARDGGQFWIVRPDLGGGMITGLNTVISGPYIEAAPGSGDTNSKFIGLDSRPVRIGEGLRIVLHTDRLAHLQVDSPVYFRGIQVGAIQDIRFSSDATHVNITAFVWKRYEKLLRPTSRFWAVTGTDIHGGVFSGISVEVNNLKALLAGGVAFATPDEGPAAIAEGTDFTLHDEAKPEWLKWSAKTELPLDDNPGQGASDPGLPPANVPDANDKAAR